MENPFLSNERKKNIEIDLQPLQSMKADRKATYNSLYRKIIKRIEKRKWKDGQNLGTILFKLISNARFKKFLKLPKMMILGSKFGVKVTLEIPKKLLHKHIVKKGITFFTRKTFLHTPGLLEL